MNTDTMPQKPKMFHRVINAIFLFLNAFMAFGIYSMHSFERVELYKKVILIMPAVFLAAFMIIKEFKVRTLVRKMYINMAIFVGLLLNSACWALVL